MVRRLCWYNEWKKEKENIPKKSKFSVLFMHSQQKAFSEKLFA